VSGRPRACIDTPRTRLEAAHASRGVLARLGPTLVKSTRWALRQAPIGAVLVVAALAPGAVAPAAAVAKQPDLDARAWAVIDARTGDVLASHAVSRRLPIASTTKLMTA